jgi:5-methylcytosine-specific restriction endonuclease McrA
MRPTDDIKAWEMDQILISIGTLQTHSGRPSITWGDFQDLLRKEPFFLQDERTHRKKRRSLEANGFLIRVNKVAYKVTEAGFARIRKVKGIPETHEDALDAEASDSITEAGVFEPSPLCHNEPVKGAEWEIIRKLILERDGHKCRICGGGGDGQPLQVHHKTPRALDGPHDPDNLITVCQRCHFEESSGEKGAVTDYLMALRNGAKVAEGVRL